MQLNRFNPLATLGLLLLSASASANPTCTDLFTDQTSLSKAVADAHASIASDLYTGRVTSIRGFKENGNRNKVFLVTVEGRDPFTGRLRVRDAIFKPAIWGDSDGWARAGMEYFTYAFNRILDMDYVPPTAYRHRLSLDAGGSHFTQGALIYKVPSYTPLANLEGEKFNVADADYHDAVESDHRILSVLLKNGDGHYWNFGQGKHWVDGKIRPAFIDWGASLRPGTFVSMTQYHAYGNSRPVSRVRAQTLAALKRLSFGDLKPYVGGFISEAEATEILHVRDGIVDYFDGLISMSGEDAILIRQ